MLALVNRWQPFLPLTICSPNSDKFISPLESGEFTEIMTASAKRSQRIQIFLAFFMSVSFSLCNIFYPDPRFFVMCTVSIILLVYFSSEYFILFTGSNTLRDRAVTINEIFSSSRVPVTVSFVFMSCIWLIQISLSDDDPEEVFINFGALYDSIENGEYWRFLSGPYLHSGLAHWLSNLVFLIIASTVAAKTSTFGALTAFIFGNLLGAITAYLLNIFSFTTGDVYVGISPGIYALFSLSSALIVLSKNSFPIRFGYSLALFAITSIAITALMFESSAHGSHITGFLFGALLGIIWPKTN